MAAQEIAVDVGHYAAEPGVISASGVPEFEFNLALALEVKAQLEKRGLKVRLIGERGDYASLGRRARDAQGADLFVSIHHDSVKERLLPQADRFSGFSIFLSRMNSQVKKSLGCGSAIGAQLRAAGFTPSRYHADPVLGESRPFADEANGVHYYDNLAVGRSAPMASVLVEAGVIVNRAEEAKLREPAVRGEIAAAIAAGVRKCLGKEE
ncbi:MAG TPA: N-acetylmuramoyl-L-alanine amidase [Burkholderiales bacterium]|nr:N-acetylmuramoyl-L-alanine amidase [Burkholderiales bacterium]